MGVWIETWHRLSQRTHLPVVTPCVGVWIETEELPDNSIAYYVTPCVGVWIETLVMELTYLKKQSHPAWVCGLKPGMENNKQSNTVVTPCVGVWIETIMTHKEIENELGHTLRGCVD